MKRTYYNSFKDDIDEFDSIKGFESQDSFNDFKSNLNWYNRAKIIIVGTITPFGHKFYYSSKTNNQLEFLGIDETFKENKEKIIEELGNKEIALFDVCKKVYRKPINKFSALDKDLCKILLDSEGFDLLFKQTNIKYIICNSSYANNLLIRIINKFKLKTEAEIIVVPQITRKSKYAINKLINDDYLKTNYINENINEESLNKIWSEVLEKIYSTLDKNN